MNSFYTIYLNGKYAPGGYDWIRGKVVSQSSFGITIEDSRGNRSIFPSHTIERMSENNGW
jgi:hypothetical protein